MISRKFNLKPEEKDKYEKNNALNLKIELDLCKIEM